MYENNIDNFNCKPLTLVNFFTKNKRSKNSNKENTTNSNYNHHNLGYTNNANVNIEKNNSNKNPKTSNSKYRYKIAQNSKTLKFNNFASSTSNNFYHNQNHNHNEYYYYNDNPISNKKYSINNYNYYNDNYGFRKSSHKKNRTKDKNKTQERIKSVFDANLYNFQNIENKEKNEQFLEQILDNYDSKFQRNMKDMKFTFNNNKHKNSQRSSNQNSLTSINYNMNNNEYINSLRFKNVIRLNNKDKIYDFLPYLHSSSKERKSISKAHKKLLVYENYNINTINAGFKPVNGNNGVKNNNNIYSSTQTLTKNSFNKNNTNKKKIFTHVSSNNVLNSFNNNITSNSNISNAGNNNIIFNNMGSVNNNYNYNIYEDSSGKNNNYFDEISRTNTAGKEEENYYNIFGKKTFSNGFYFAKRKDNDKEKINENEKITNINEINENKKSNQKIIRNFNFLKEDKNVGKEKEKDLTNSNSNKIRALSTAPHKNRNKNLKRNTINIDCNNENKDKDKEKANENNNDKINLENSESNHNKNIKKDKMSKYEIGETLGKGAYAVVKKIKNIITNEEFAVKIYEKEKLNSNSKKSCVNKEIQILKRLNHKNIAKLIEVISNEKQIFVIQELVEGISLREYYNDEIRHQKGISIHKENIFRTIFKQIFEAMDYVHKKGMAHRDIKLENILIKKNYEIKIIDFGFGMYNPENKLQKFFCGTPNYMAPEIAEKKPYNGQLADMWSLGILVFKIFCADFPFKGKNEKELYKAIKTGKFTMASYTPEYAKKIITSLIVLNPNKRMTCEEVLNSDWLKDK